MEGLQQGRCFDLQGLGDLVKLSHRLNTESGEPGRSGLEPLAHGKRFRQSGHGGVVTSEARGPERGGEALNGEPIDTGSDLFCYSIVKSWVLRSTAGRCHGPGQN